MEAIYVTKVQESVTEAYNQTMIDLKKKKKGRKRTNKMRNAKRNFRCLYKDQGVKTVDK